MKTLLVSLVLLAVTTAAEAQIAYRSRSTATKTQIATFQTALRVFKDDCGRYPATAEGLQALIICPKDIATNSWHGPYLDCVVIPLDPWGHEYVYRYPGIHNTNGFDIYSCGADGISKSGGADPDDINNWDELSPRKKEKENMRTPYEISTIRHQLTASASSLFISIVVARWYRRHSKAAGNRHGVIALIWVLGVVSVVMAMILFGLPDMITMPLGLLLILSLFAAAWLAVSGLRRGCLLSKTFGSIAILLLWTLLCLALMPMFFH
jgi:general secretion pathway protein G